MADGSHARPVNLRIREDVRSLIDQAARAQGKSRSEFMIDAARRAAEEALLDRAFVAVDAKTFDWFKQVLDKGPNEGFDRLMAVRPPWSK